MEKPFDSAISFLPPQLKAMLLGIREEIKDKICEIRLRAGKCIVLKTEVNTLFADKDKVTFIYTDGLYKLSDRDILDAFNRLCNFSVYSHADDIAQGFITLNKGHRVGICGTAVTENGRITSIKSVSSLNIRIAREFRGCADEIIENIFKRGLTNVIIAGPPTSGKTTLLRDIVRQVSSGKTGDYRKVTVVDERCEIAPMSSGICNFDLGPDTDVLSSFMKAEGIMCALRTLSPDLIVCDEIGSTDECEAIKNGLNSGVNFALSIHASSVSELKNKPQFNSLLQSGTGGKVVILGREPCKINDIIPMGEFNVKNSFAFSHCSSSDNCRAVC